MSGGLRSSSSPRAPVDHRFLERHQVVQTAWRRSWSLAAWFHLPIDLALSPSLLIRTFSWAYLQIVNGARSISRMGRIPATGKHARCTSPGLYVRLDLIWTASSNCRPVRLHDQLAPEEKKPWSGKPASPPALDRRFIAGRVAGIGPTEPLGFLGHQVQTDGAHKPVIPVQKTDWWLVRPGWSDETPDPLCRSSVQSITPDLSSVLRRQKYEYNIILNYTNT